MLDEYIYKALHMDVSHLKVHHTSHSTEKSSEFFIMLGIVILVVNSFTFVRYTDDSSILKWMLLNCCM